jgi:signal transduction histidine kinase
MIPDNLDCNQYQNNTNKSFNAQWLIVILAIVALFSVSLYDIYDDRQQLITGEQHRLMTQARVIEVNLTAQLESALSVLRSIARHSKEGKDIGHRLGELRDAMPGVSALLILDANGIVKASNFNSLVGIDFSYRDYYTVPRKELNKDVLYFSPPFRTTFDRYVMTMSAIIPDQTGGFNGIVAASLDPDYFKTLLQSVRYVDDMWSVIMHGDGLMFMSIPESVASPGKDLAVPGTFYTRHRDSGKAENMFTGKSYLAGEERMVAMLTFNPPELRLNRPLVIVASRKLSEVVSGWWRDTAIKVTAVVFLSVFLVLGTAVMQRREQKLDQQSRNLLAERIAARHELLRAQEAEQYAALIQGILESTSSAVFSVDISFNYTSFNLSHAKIMKELYNGDIHVGANLLGYMPFEHAEIARANLARALAGESFVVDASFDSLKGKRQYFEISHNPIINSEGVVAGIAVFAYETTERIETLNALTEANHLFSTFMKYSPVYCYIKKVTETDSFTLVASDNFEKLVGIPASRMIGRSLFEIFPEEFARKIMADDLAVIRDGKVLELDEELGGRYYTTIKFPIVKDGVTLLAGYTIDITGRKQAEEDVQRKNREIQQFIYVVSHDLRSPLVTIKTFAGYLEQDLANANRQQISDDLSFINKAAAKMEILLNELLAMSRAGHQAAENSEMTFRQLADDAAAAVAGQIAERGVEVHIADMDIRLYGDRTRLTQIWQNLLDNSIKYMGDQPVPFISIGAEQKFNDVVFYICDNGIGISHENLDKMFNIFEKLGHQSDGVGMGLAMVKRIVELNNGRIWAESRGPGHGACFRFTLPGVVNSHPDLRSSPSG